MSVSEKLIAEGVEVSLGEGLLFARPMRGGCIGKVYLVELVDGTPLVAKVDRDGEAHLDREAYMLSYLREKSELPVPEVFHSSDTLLLMQFVEGNSTFSNGAERHAAELLAELHGIAANDYGHERNTLIGNLDQPNPWTKSWTYFFREHRLLYMADTAYEAGRLPVETRQRIDRLAERLDDFIRQPNPPSLIHGDAWSANVLANGDRITAFLDPAIYHADPEIELAYISIFKSFGKPFFERYAVIRGIDEGFFKTRRDLYSLYPLLTHVYYFGGGYLHLVEQTLRRFGV